jgi:Na+-driven multidrug efflux pump
MIGVILIQRSINQYSDILHDQSLITAFLAAGRSEAIFTVPLFGLGTMMTSYCGQIYGDKDYDRLKKGFIFTTYLVFIYSIIIGVILFFIGPSLIYLFLDETTESLIKYTSTYFKINVFFYIALGLILIYRNGLQAMGDGKVCLLGGVVELISRGVVALALPIYFGYQVLYFGGPIAWFTAGVLFTIRVIMFMKKKKATLIAQRQELLQEAVPNLV